MENEQKRASGLGGRPEARLFEQTQEGYGNSLDLLMARHEPLVRYAANRQNYNPQEVDQARKKTPSYRPPGQ
jgi:hypothetical protein